MTNTLLALDTSHSMEEEKEECEKHCEVSDRAPSDQLKKEDCTAHRQLPERHGPFREEEFSYMDLNTYQAVVVPALSTQTPPSAQILPGSDSDMKQEEDCVPGYEHCGDGHSTKSLSKWSLPVMEERSEGYTDTPIFQTVVLPTHSTGSPFILITTLGDDTEHNFFNELIH